MLERDYILYAINYMGGQKKMAKYVGITQQAVSAWLRNGVPLPHALFLDQLTEGELKKEKLAPEFF